MYYVYRLIDPRNGNTFYIGKGKGNRVFEHIKCALKDDEEEDNIDRKYQTINEINRSGLGVLHIIHRHGMDEDTAFEVEAALIDAYPGTTNKVGGKNSSNVGPMNAYEILTTYGAEEVEFKHNVLFITINRSINETSVYEAVRYAWRINVERARKAEYVLAVEKGLIVGVFRATEWKTATEKNFPEKETHNENRYGFIGEEAPLEIQVIYLRKRIPDRYRQQGAANPVKYSF